MADKNPIIDRNYVDNYSVKEFASNELVPMFFPDQDVSKRTVGMVGYTTELLSNICEDAFNTASVLFRETYPNRAQTEESILSHAALFQLSNIFSTASSCKFLLVLEENSIIENMQDSYNKDTGMYYFYIDKNTTIYVEDIPYTLDYDIELTIVKKISTKGDEYLFSASYITDEYTNSLSSISDPYISIKRSNNGFIALEIICHQCVRDEREEPITSTSAINYPVVDIDFSGSGLLAGFDILYKTSDETTYSTQLNKQVVYSQPSTKPFCYYQLKEADVLRITFNTKDGYFVPDLNCDIKVILYLTNGTSANFDEYTGSDIQISTDDNKYGYTSNYIVASKPMTGSEGGTDSLSIDGLQSLTVEGYSTANALTTDHDLEMYFDNYKYRFGDIDIKFIKKRNDIFERVFSSFIVMRYKDFIYKTNCLNLNINLGEMINNEENIYMLKPGLLFTANDDNGEATLLRNTRKTQEYYKLYQKAIQDGKIDYVADNFDKTDLPSYLDRPASFAEFKRRNGLDDKLSVFNTDPIDLQKLDDPSENKFLLINPFLIRFKKNPNLVSLYMTYINQKPSFDFTDENKDCFVQFIMYQLEILRDFNANGRFEFKTKLMSSVSIDNKNAIIDGIYDKENDEIKYTLGDKFNVINNDLRVVLVISDGIHNLCYTELFPTEYNPEEGNFTFSGYMETDDHITSTGKLRILDGTIYRNYDNGTYYVAHEDDPTLYDQYDKYDVLMVSNVSVDTVTDLTNNNNLIKYSQVVNMSSSEEVLIPMENAICKVYTIYRRMYNETTHSLALNSSDQTNNSFIQFDKTFDRYIWTNEYSTKTETVTFMKPLNNVRSQLEFKDFTISYTEENEDGSNITKYRNDIMDVSFSQLPFIRWDIANDYNLITHFMSIFMNTYNHLSSIVNTRLRNVTAFDVKFYNTYGRSRNFIIGEDNELLDVVNLKLELDTWFVPGTDLLVAKPEVRKYIKQVVESVNTDGMNNLFISNLITKVETHFGYVDHLRFKRINHFPSTYQAVRNKTNNLNELTVEERRVYVPELLVIDLEDIIINDYYSD